MAEPAPIEPGWSRRGAWDGVARPGRHGSPEGSVGIVVTRRERLSLVTLTVPPERADALAAAAEAALGFALPSHPRAVGARGVTAVWSGPGQWLCLSREPDLTSRLAAALGEEAAFADQTGGRAILSLAGPDVHALLAKGVMIDLHPACFAPGDAAVTSIGHIGVQIWREPDLDGFVLAISSSYAGSFWSWLVDSAGEFGLALR